MQCSLAEMVFETRNETRNQAPLMDVASHTVYPKLKGDEHDANTNSKTFVAEFYIDDTEYANRFVKAFRHAVVLCGGTPSPFRPVAGKHPQRAMRLNREFPEDPGAS